MGFSVKGIIGTVAPMLATALGGPMAGQAVASIARSMGLKEDAKLGDVQQALASGQLTGDQLVALKAAEMQFQEHMALAGFENTEKLEALAAQDRDSARVRETKVMDWTPRILAYVIVGAFVFVIITTLRGWSKVESALAGTLIGYLSAKAEQVISYYFGSSAGSAEKTKLLSQAPAIENKP